ncbi:uncharacterized protein LOC127845775 [Dreissena polymorpha]|uniref:uncharacterized protein LOC127845775 n=1 Tax=Dreissena polymorpha TaxID=45954 RepID=UPI002263C8E5|nr:uncharacterized protein LOC127845775 [Dreissena polymorpha]
MLVDLVFVSAHHDSTGVLCGGGISSEFLGCAMRCARGRSRVPNRNYNNNCRHDCNNRCANTHNRWIHPASCHYPDTEYNNGTAHYFGIYKSDGVNHKSFNNRCYFSNGKW